MSMRLTFYTVSWDLKNIYLYIWKLISRVKSVFYLIFFFLWWARKISYFRKTYTYKKVKKQWSLSLCRVALNIHLYIILHIFNYIFYRLPSFQLVILFVFVKFFKFYQFKKNVLNVIFISFFLLSSTPKAPIAVCLQLVTFH